MKDSKPDTVTGLALEYLEGKHQGKGADVSHYLARLTSDAERSEFTRLLDLYDEIDEKLTRKELVAPGTIIGELRIIKWLGQGGMGVVYLAEQIALKRLVAVKLLPTPLLQNDRALERFRREVMTLAALRHPGIVPVHTVGTHAGMPYFTMDYVEGPTLQEVFESLSPMRPDQLDAAALRRACPSCDANAFTGSYIDVIVRLIADVADALHHAHENGVLHRDVKPLNVLLARDGRALLFDFGLARESGAATLTRTGELAGSPYYVAPEQLRPGGSVDRRVDVYALGVTLFQALTLVLPFTGDSAQDVLRSVLIQEPPSIRKLNPTVHVDLETICAKAMDRNPSRRFASAKELADDLRRFLAHRPIAARPLDFWTRVARSTRRHPLLAATALAVLIMLVTLLAYPLYARTAQLALAKSYHQRGELEPASAMRCADGGAVREPQRRAAPRAGAPRCRTAASPALAISSASGPRAAGAAGAARERRPRPSTLLAAYRAPAEGFARERACARSRTTSASPGEPAQEARGNLMLAAKEDGPIRRSTSPSSRWTCRTRCIAATCGGAPARASTRARDRPRRAPAAGARAGHARGRACRRRGARSRHAR
ncbi:MAG: serine/threonine-protein kinase [Planctomycetota bacterium]